MAYTTLNKMVQFLSIIFAVLLIISFVDVESMTKIASNVCENIKLFNRKILDEL